MKARIITSLMALAALLAASCAKESGQKETVPLPQVPISVEASVSGLTKAVTNGLQTSFEANDQLTLYAWTGSAAAVSSKKVVDGVVNTFDGTKWTPASTMLWKNVFDAHYFLGISPARTVNSFTADPVSSSEDLLVATVLGDGIVAPQTVTAPPVALEFSHVMAWLKVNVKYRNQWGGVPEAVVTTAAATAGTIDYLTKTITPGTVATQTLAAATTAAEGYDATYTALCIPQGISTINFTIAGQTLVYTHSEDIVLEAGKVTTLTLLVGKDKIALENNTVSDWEEGVIENPSEPGSAQLGDVTRPLTLKAAEDGTTVTFRNKSLGTVTWITGDGRTGNIIRNATGSISLDKGQKVWFLGNGSNRNYSDGDVDGSSLISMDKDCEVYGNIMSLLNSSFATLTTLPDYNTFSYLFKGQTHLKNNADEGLILPATELTSRCYRGMFQGCTGLTQVVVNATAEIETGTQDWLSGVPGAEFSLITPVPLQWRMGDKLPWGATVCTLGENGVEKVYTTPTIVAETLTYNGTAQKLINAGAAHKDGLVLEYSPDAGSTWGTAIPTGTDARNYSVYCRVKDGDAYSVQSAAMNKTIQPKVVTNPTITLSQTSYTYNGSACKPSVTSVKDGNNTIASSEYTVGYSNNINAGTATVTISDKTGGNYTVSGSKTFTINKVPCSVASAPTAKSLTFNGSRSNYNGSAQTLVNAGTASGGSMKYKVGNGGWSTNLPSATNAGTYTVYYKAAGDANHIDSAEGSVQVTIAKANGFIESTLTTYSTNVFGGNTGTVYASGELSGYVMSNAMGDNMNLKLINNTTPPSYSVSVSTTGPFSYITLVFSCTESANYKAVDEKSISLTLQE